MLVCKEEVIPVAPDDCIEYDSMSRQKKSKTDPITVEQNQIIPEPQKSLRTVMFEWFGGIGSLFGILIGLYQWVLLPNITNEIDKQLKPINTDITDIKTSVSAIHASVNLITKMLFKSAADIAKNPSATPSDKMQLAALIDSARIGGFDLPRPEIADIAHTFSQIDFNRPPEESSWSVLNATAAYQSKQSTKKKEALFERYLGSTKLLVGYTAAKPPDFTRAPGGVPRDRAAIIEPLTQPNLQKDDVGPEFIYGKCSAGQNIALDGYKLKNIVINSCPVIYEGGPVELTNVTFINCTFVTKQVAPSRDLLLAVIQNPDDIKFSFGTRG